jgi:hypothetical protein
MGAGLIRRLLDRDDPGRAQSLRIPRACSKELSKAKCDLVYQYFHEAYLGQGQSVYAVS